MHNGWTRFPRPAVFVLSISGDKGSMITPAVKNIWLCKLFVKLLVLLLLVGLSNLMAPMAALADQSDSVEITGDGVTAPVTLTLSQLEGMKQYEHVYSVINTWPTKKWYIGKGVKLRDLLALAGMTEEARLIRFVSNDGYEVTLTVKELFKDKRYYFSRLMDNHASDGSVPGSPEGAREVEPILALISSEGSDNPAEMNDRDALLLLIGQRAVTEQNNNLFLKYVAKIEVLTDAPPKWDSPKASVAGGEVPAGTKIELSNKHNDADKVYYTTDGSIPTINSPMYNKSAKRWWPLRPDDLDSVNRPIEIKKDTVIKAVTIGPGKEDSDVVTFTYKADLTGKAADPAKRPAGPPTKITLDQDTASLKVGNTIELVASIEPYNTMDHDVTWSSSDTRVATVDGNGLVTVVGPGTATITARTVAGNLSASCVVHGQSLTNAGSQQSGSREMPKKAPVPESGRRSPAENEIIATNRQSPAEKKAAAGDSTTADRQPEIPAEQPVPEANRQYLAEKKEVAAASTTGGVTPEQPDVQPWRVFEMSADDIPLKLQEEADIQDGYAAVVFLLLFLTGAIKRYLEYAKEVAR
ncbi:chitobiase/beta-hexosaminidase C-terminal domain-containing protein [Pelotomaculum isophthalicicum JI]|uniref:Chitobiase/beta-hexosaminidase C-terminal domain-containing protein n=1 Tax=Pelotomaculum isophthalicicum JI TaxID=947010 RepID=A0A9X4JWF6_9FIRM|nr:Ig-like domain-containing protein [Pelotomaculum isophthalicicum]MDF9409013.1 chitobiase/beta-hexosaminidase C-terminal domain-containing protein [Pelotomaculum isophthalicicum JI]